MTFRVARPLSPALRASIRSRHTLSASSLVRKRYLTSGQASGKPASDLPWIIGSTLIFGPIFLYMLNLSMKKTATPGHDSHESHPPSHAKQEDIAESPKDEETGSIGEDEGSADNAHSSGTDGSGPLASDSDSENPSTLPGGSGPKTSSSE